MLHQSSNDVREGLPKQFHMIKLLFMAAAFVALALSVGLWFAGNREEGLFVGLWVPAIHSLGTLVLTGERIEGGGRS